MRLHIGAALLSLALLPLASAPSFAATIDLAVSGNADVGATFFDFNTSFLGTGTYAPPGSYGQFLVNSPPTSFFTSQGVSAGTLGTVLSLSAVTDPVNTPLNLDFMNFSGSPLELILTNLSSGNVSPLSPFSTMDTSSGAVVSFAFQGHTAGSTTPNQAYMGVFSATFAGTTVAQLIGQLPKATSFSGTVTLTPVPEPVTSLLMGAGLLGVGLFARRRRASSK
jgi:hypothetical protein